jgi:origin recognition complex subunit 1
LVVCSLLTAHRHEFQNEIYFSLSSCAVLPISQVICHCKVSGEPPPLAECKSTFAWSLSPTKRPRTRTNCETADEETEGFFCHLAVDPKRGLFYGIDWEDHCIQALNDLSAHEWESDHLWNVVVDEDLSRSPQKKRRKLVAEVEEIENEQADDGEEEYHPQNDADDSEDELPSFPLLSRESPLFTDPEELPKTPSRKRTRTTATVTPKKTPKKAADSAVSATPRRTRRPLAVPTPHSKLAIRARRERKKAGSKTKSFPVPALEDNYSKQNQQLDLPTDPWLRAMHVLHVAARPDVLPCREEEFSRVLRAVEELLEEGSGGCVCTCLFLASIFVL